MERSLDEKVANQVRGISRDAMGKDRDAIRVWVATRWQSVATRKKVLTSTRDAMDKGRDAILVKDLGHTRTRSSSRHDEGGIATRCTCTNSKTCTFELKTTKRSKPIILTPYPANTSPNKYKTRLISNTRFPNQQNPF